LQSGTNLQTLKEKRAVIIFRVERERQSAVKKRWSIVHPEWVSGFLQIIQHAMPMHRFILSPVAYLAGPYFSTLSHEWQDFRKKSYWIQNVYFDFIYKFYPRYFSLEEEFSEVIP